MKSVMFISGVLMLGLVCSEASGGILGRRYGAAYIGQLTPGDSEVKRIATEIQTYEAGVRMPCHRKVDIVAALSRAELDGSTSYYDGSWQEFATVKVDEVSHSLLVMAQMQLSGTDQLTPYIGAGVVHTRVKFQHQQYRRSGLKIGNSEGDDNDTGVRLGGGLEFRFGSRASINGGVAYVSEMFSSADIAVGAGLNVWITESLLLSVVGQYSFETQNNSIGGGLGIGF